MKRRISMLLITALCSTAAFAQTNYQFRGGNGDGYDEMWQGATVTFPQINNAGGATNIMDISASLNGTLICTGGAPTTVYVYWGTVDGTNNAGSWDNSTNFGIQAEGAALTTNVTGLSQYTTYYYRFYTTNANGEAWAYSSADFVTYGAPILNDGGGALVARTSATLRGNLTDGGSSHVYIYFGQDTNSWAATNYLGELGMGAFSMNEAGLSGDSTYYYHCYASNAYGGGWADVSEFTTSEMLFLAGGDADGHDNEDEFSVAAAIKGTIFIITQARRAFGW